MHWSLGECFHLKTVLQLCGIFSNYSVGRVPPTFCLFSLYGAPLVRTLELPDGFQLIFYVSVSFVILCEISSPFSPSSLFKYSFLLSCFHFRELFHCSVIFLNSPWFSLGAGVGVSHSHMPFITWVWGQILFPLPCVPCGVPGPKTLSKHCTYILQLRWTGEIAWSAERDLGTNCFLNTFQTVLILALPSSFLPS